MKSRGSTLSAAEVKSLLEPHYTTRLRVRLFFPEDRRAVRDGEVRECQFYAAFLPAVTGSAMNLIALLLEMLFGRTWRLQSVPVRPTRRGESPTSSAEFERNFVRSEVCTLAAMGWLTGSNPSLDPDAIAEQSLVRYDPYPARAAILV